MFKNFTYPEHPVLLILVALVVGMLTLVRWTWNAAAFVMKVAVRAFIHSLSWSFAAIFSRKAETRKAKKTASMVAARESGHVDFQDTVAVSSYRPQTSDFKVADRIIPIPLEPAGLPERRGKRQYECNSIAVLHLRVYYADKTVKREMIVTERNLRSIMGGRRFEFPDAKFEPSVGLEQIKDDTVELAQQLFDKAGKMRVNQGTRRRELTEPVIAKQAQPVAQPQADAKPVPAKAESEPDNASDSGSAKPRNHFKAQTGVTFTGKLVYAKEVEVSYPGKQPYNIFEARIEMANGVEVPLRGAELARELSAKGVKPGEMVSITPHGKVPVELGNGKTGSKNIYEVRRI